MGHARHFILPIVLAAASGAPAAAETPHPIIAPEGERFTLTPAEGGFVRLNKETGAVSYCSVKDGVTVCRLGAEERAALEAEINRLRKENAELKARADAAPGPQAARPNATPSEEEFERALSFTERLLRRIMRVFREETSPGRTL
ncbi:MAG: hypothetical protein AB7F41_00830 [Methylocystis sp.]|uniref:hypothetical protein n=1 Tax=Methylocystis sp. TaxID=1911079 RepID=UPI003D09C465